MKSASPPTARRPGWPELAIGVAVYAAAYTATPFLIDAVGGDDPASRGLTAAALSGIIGLLGFAAAIVLRRRPVAGFGLVRAQSGGRSSRSCSDLQSSFSPVSCSPFSSPPALSLTPIHKRSTVLREPAEC